MNKTSVALTLFLISTMLLLFTGIAGATELDHVVGVQKYNRAIHIMAMLLAGFGFLMVFVKKYARTFRRLIHYFHC
ncbi:MAG: hypothetical protein U9Q39_05155 [Pseudomonadota bacterium]|nr:hypothetical protein [Pseudomonadota bacterium]